MSPLNFVLKIEQFALYFRFRTYDKIHHHL
jgi:hypothetical protein